MKVLFLDIDGVLNSKEWCQAKNLDPNVPCDFVLCEVDPETVKHVNTILEQTGAKVVISSTWRLRRPLPQFKTMLEEIDHILKKCGFKGEIIGATPNRFDRPNGWADGERGHECMAWVSSHPEVTAYCAIDDDSDFTVMMDHLVQTDWHHGLRAQDAEKAIEILGKLCPRCGYAYGSTSWCSLCGWL